MGIKYPITTNPITVAIVENTYLNNNCTAKPLKHAKVCYDHDRLTCCSKIRLKRRDMCIGSCCCIE